MLPDFQCTLWPDSWLGISITHCCVEHDLSGTDAALAECVAYTLADASLVFGLLLAAIMFIGVKLFRPIYTYLSRRRSDG